MLPFVDLKKQFRGREAEIRAAIDRVLEHCQFILGPEVAELEAQLAAYAGVKHAIACSSGTDALLLALMAKGIGPGDAVFTTPFTFFATAEAVALTGATPIFVDIDPHTFNLDPASLEQAIIALLEQDQERHVLPRSGLDRCGKPLELRPKAIVAVDLFGLPADYQRLQAIAAAHDLVLIEDAAQSFGAELNGRRAGSLADLAATSFFPAKPLGCYGDGGAVFTDSDDAAAIVRSLAVHGQGEDRYWNERIGLNARLDTLQAAVLLAKLPVFPDELKLRAQVAERYTQALSPVASVLRPPQLPPGCRSAWAQYSLLTEQRDPLRRHLADHGIPTAVYYPQPLHLQPAFAHLGYRAGDMPVAEGCARTIFSLPCHPYLEWDEVDRIADLILEFILSRLWPFPRKA